MAVTGWVQTCKTTSSFIALRMSSRLTCNVWLWLFDAQYAWLYSANLLFSWRSLYWLCDSRHAGYSQPPTSWVVLIDWYILAGRSPQEPIPTRPRHSVVHGKCNIGRWQIFTTANDYYNPQGWNEYISKQVVRFLICIKLRISLVFLCQMNVI